MGTPQPTMAATQILVALCVVGSAVAAPQLSLGRSRSVGSSAGTNINENQVVTSVITSLTPSISKAVEEALAAVAAAERAAAEQAAAEQAAAEQAAAAAAAAAEAERIEAQRRAAQAEAARQQQIAAANAAAAAAAPEKNSFDSQVSADLGPFVDPVYNFEYKVADDVEKTYISRNEERDGNELSRSYSFIDATGALVTVDYTAGVNGYAETRSKEAGKVTMKAVPAWDGPLAGLEEASGAVAVAKGATSSSSRFGSSSGSRSSSVATSSSSQSDLIAQILAALTPQINSAVAASLA